MRSVSQSLPPASIVGQLLEEPSEFSSDVFAEPLHYDEEVESLLRQDSVTTPPPAKKQALDNEQTQRDEAEGVVVEMKDSLFDSSEAPKHEEEEESDQPADGGQVAESRVEGQVEETQVESKEAKNDNEQKPNATERESKEGEYDEKEVPTESIVSTDPTEVEEIQTSHLLNEENEEKASQPEPEGADSDSGDIIEEPAQDSTEVEMDETERHSKEREDTEEEEELPTESSVLHVSEEEEVQISRLLNKEKILQPEPEEADNDSEERHESMEGEAKQLSNEMETSKGLILLDSPEEPGVEELARDSIEVEMEEAERESKEQEDKEEEELPTESSVLHVSEEEELQISRLLNKEKILQPEPEGADSDSGDIIEEPAQDSIEVEMEEAERESKEQEDKEEEELPTESSVLHVSEEEEVQISRLLNEENEENVSQPEPEEADSDSEERHESMEEVEARRLSGEIVIPKGSILSHSTEEPGVEKPAQDSTDVEANLSAAEEEGTESLETATKAAKVETTTPRVEEETVSIDTETEATKAEAQGEIRDEKEDEVPVETENEDSQTVEFKTDVQSEVTSLPDLPLTPDTSEANVTAQNSIGTNEDVGTHEMHEKEDDGETEPEKSESEDESGKEERVEERDEEYDRQPVLTTEHQLTQRHAHSPREDESLQATSDVTEPSVAMVAQTNVGLFGVMQSRLRRWGIGRRSMLVFGALTVASFVFLGVNFFYDTANVNDAQA